MLNVSNSGHNASESELTAEVSNPSQPKEDPGFTATGCSLGILAYHKVSHLDSFDT